MRPKKCPICNSTRVISDVNGMKCEKCGFVVKSGKQLIRFVNKH